MKVQNILTLGSVLGLSLLAGQASADVSAYVSNIHPQTVTSTTSWLDLNSANGNQDMKYCYFKQGPAAVSFSAETTSVQAFRKGWLNAKIWVNRNVGFLNPGADDFAMDTAKVLINDWEGHSTHAGFWAPVNGWYQVKVWAQTKGGQAKFRVDDTSLICMN